MEFQREQRVTKEEENLVTDNMEETKTLKVFFFLYMCQISLAEPTETYRQIRELLEGLVTALKSNANF